MRQTTCFPCVPIPIDVVELLANDQFIDAITDGDAWLRIQQDQGELQAIHKSPTGCNTRPLSISNVSWMFDLYFLIYYRIQFYCAIQDDRPMLDDKSTIKNTALSPCCHLSISKVSWMFDKYFLIYCRIQFYCAIQDGHHDGHVWR